MRHSSAWELGPFPTNEFIQSFIYSSLDLWIFSCYTGFIFPQDLPAFLDTFHLEVSFVPTIYTSLLGVLTVSGTICSTTIVSTTWLCLRIRMSLCNSFFCTGENLAGTKLEELKVPPLAKHCFKASLCEALHWCELSRVYFLPKEKGNVHSPV